MLNILLDTNIVVDFYEGVNCLNGLRNNSKRRLPKDLIEKTIEKIKLEDKILI